MRSTEDITNTLNTLSYIELLPKDEQIIELRKITKYYKY